MVTKVFIHGGKEIRSEIQVPELAYESLSITRWMKYKWRIHNANQMPDKQHVEWQNKTQNKQNKKQKQKTSQSRNLYPVNISFKNKGKIKTFSHVQGWKNLSLADLHYEKC